MKRLTRTILSLTFTALLGSALACGGVEETADTNDALTSGGIDYNEPIEGILEPGDVLVPGEGTLGEPYGDTRTHQCKSGVGGNSRDHCNAFFDACRRFTGYDATPTGGNETGSVTYSCSCDGPQIASTDFCDRKIRETLN